MDRQIHGCVSTLRGILSLAHDVPEPVGEEPRMIAADISFWTVPWYGFAGLVIGLIAPAIMPGRQHMNIFVAIALGTEVADSIWVEPDAT